jgi:hypothetical protein
MSAPKLVPLLKDTDSAQIIAVTAETTGKLLSEKCTRVRELGYRPSAHAKLYGQHFEIVSDPFPEGNGVAVRAVTATDPTVRTLRLPLAILLGLRDFFPKTPVIGPGLDRTA